MLNQVIHNATLRLLKHQWPKFFSLHQKFFVYHQYLAKSTVFLAIENYIIRILLSLFHKNQLLSLPLAQTGREMLNIEFFFKRNKNLLLILFFVLTQSPVYHSALAGQDIWLIDTRQTPWNCATETGFEKTVYYQLIDHRWVRSDAETFFETQFPDVPLVLFSPGYTSTTSDTVEVGMSLVRLYNPEQNCRTVFWNWPAEKIRLPLGRDIREKIAVTEASAVYLAMFLRRLQPESQVCMIGFSFGNRIICDAVKRLGDDRPDGMRLHLVLTASATDYCWFASGSRHGEVPRLAEKILILYNPADRALQFYPLLYGNGSRPDALGRFGPPMARIAPEYRDHIEAINVQLYLGNRHRTIYYLQTSVFRQRMNDYLFFE